MQITLYKVSDEPTKLNKTLIGGVTINGKFRTELDNIDVIIEIETIDLDFNYVSIQPLNKYYFVKNIINVNAKITRLILHLDVLMTYKTDILNSKGLVIKGGVINPYYSTFESETREIVNRYEYPYTFNSNGNYVLVTITNNGLEG